RNFAYKQNAVLSSNYKNFGGDKAVDGNRNAHFVNNSCAHSGLNDERPKLTLTLSQPVVITRVVLYNRNENQMRLMNFILQMFKKNGIPWFSHQDHSETPLPVYTVLIPIKEQTERMSITATYFNTYFNSRYDTKPILILCEMEAYG
ncbi:tyrosine-protein kinase receptor Tie-2, partial [Biomphalaria glabrata]